MLNTFGQSAIIAVSVFLFSLIGLSWYKQGLPPFARGQIGEGQTQRAVGAQYNPKASQGSSERIPEQHSQEAEKEEGSIQRSVSSKEESDAALANYTFWLTYFTFILAVATIGLVIVTVGLWWYAGEQAKDMKHAILASLTANKIAIDENRPWIGHPRIAAENLNGIYKFRITFSNSGKTVARGVHMGVELRDELVPDFASIHEAYRQLLIQDPSRYERFVMIPGQDFPVLTTNTNSYVAVEIDPTSFNHPTERYLNGTIFYRIPSDDRVHVTNYHAVVTIAGGTVTVGEPWSVDVD